MIWQPWPANTRCPGHRSPLAPGWDHGPVEAPGSTPGALRQVGLSAPAGALVTTGSTMSSGTPCRAGPAPPGPILMIPKKWPPRLLGSTPRTSSSVRSQPPESKPSEIADGTPQMPAIPALADQGRHRAPSSTVTERQAALTTCQPATGPLRRLCQIVTEPAPQADNLSRAAGSGGRPGGPLYRQGFWPAPFWSER